MSTVIFPIQRIGNWAKANGRTEKYEAMNASIGTMVKEQDNFLRSHTVLEMLEYMNSDAMAAKGVAWYGLTVVAGAYLSTLS